MSGGTWENVMSIMYDANNQLPNEFENIEAKYYDSYRYSINSASYHNRILGDATGEMGPFNSVLETTDPRYFSSWYNDMGLFAYANAPYFMRGAARRDGNLTGIFAFLNVGNVGYGFRLILTPT